MNVIAVNGSPRKKWNTATLLQNALEGAASRGAATELVHLYDLDYKGCVSCFACKTRDGKSYGRCAYKDGLSPVLENIAKADALILGTPIFFGSASGAMRSFLERLMFPYLAYTADYKSLFPRNIPTAFIHTMNVTGEQARDMGYEYVFGAHERYLGLIFGSSERLIAYDTCQFEDYSKVVVERFDADHKLRRRREVFPQECERAFELGARLAGKKLE